MKISSTSIKEHEGYLKRSQLKAGDILFSIVGTLGRVGIVKNKDLPANTNQQISIIRVNNIDTLFLVNYLKSPSIKQFIDSERTIGAQPSISLWQINKLNINIPSLAEQEKIGNFFQKLDRLIDINKQKLGKLKASKSAYLEEMFPGEGEDRPKRRFKGFIGPWKYDKAKNICSISTGKSNTQDRNPNGKYPFYVRSPRIECSTKYLYNEEAVLTVGDGVGTGKVFHYVNGKYDLHQCVYRMFDFNNIMAKYFYYYFSVKFYDRVMSMTARTSVDSVRYEMISEMNVLYPSIEEQVKIIKFLEILDDQIGLQEEKLEKLEKMKKAYLAEMFV